MKLKNKIRLALTFFILLILIGYIFFLPLSLNDSYLKGTYSCMYGSPLKTIFSIMFTIIVLFWLYLGMMIRIELYRKVSKSDSLIDFFKVRNSSKFLKELIHPSYKKDKRYMKKINISRILTFFVIIAFIIGSLTIINCPA